MLLRIFIVAAPYKSTKRFVTLFSDTFNDLLAIIDTEDSVDFNDIDTHGFNDSLIQTGGGLDDSELDGLASQPGATSTPVDVPPKKSAGMFSLAKVLLLSTTAATK